MSRLEANPSLTPIEVIKNPFLCRMVGSKLDPPLNTVVTKSCLWMGINLVDINNLFQIDTRSSSAPFRYLEKFMVGWQAVTIFV